jgi:hypothetical protein
MRVERLIVALCALLGVAGLFMFARHIWKASGPQQEPSGITVSWEILTIYAPQALIDFAKAHPEIATNDELVRLIREAKLNVWFATVARLYRANGSFTDVPIWYRPGERPEYFEIVKAVLVALAGNRPEPGLMAYANARIEVIDDAMMEMVPAEAVRQLRPFAESYE